jgi:DNA-binding NtrC family response regulator/tetratricopeptide (TPR) repeat protein
MLPDVRRFVGRAGLPQVTAYLHNCVGVLEGQTGRLDEARRHLDIAESLLRLAPNLWLAGSVQLNRGSLEGARCEFERALNHFQAAKEIAKQSGHQHNAVAAAGSLGHVQVLLGQFEKAKHTLEGVLNNTRALTSLKLGTADAIAKLHLALGELDRCDQALHVIENQVQQHPEIASSFHARWAAIARARLLIKQRVPEEALRWLDTAKQQALQVGDVPLEAAAHLLTAQVLSKEERLADCSAHLSKAHTLGITAIRDLQAQYYYGSAMILRGRATPLEQHLRDRALRVWTDQGIVAVRLEMDDQPPDAPMTETPSIVTEGAPSVECVTDSIAAFTDLAYRPRLLGDEMLLVLNALTCSPDARLVETREKSEPPQASDTTVVLPLGVDRKRQVTLVCRIPDDPVKAILLADVLRLGRSALALEKAREEERNRAALWPAPPIEEQAGALFIAEEMKALLATARRIAPTSVPVLITGETGTGKEVLARTVHAYSSRASATFLPFNCSSVPKDMLDSQLFGHRKGAFTGAAEHFPGVIRAAAGGTLFLDEIGETTLDVQPKLLRFLESNEVHPIGETQPVRVDVRVIAATNADLDALVTQGRLREDLFYRLNIVRLHVPPLRERRVEIPSLAHHYLEKHAQEYRKGYLRLAEETMEYLVLYRWPGNVRQLANEMRRMAALAETDAVLMPEHLSAEIAASRRTLPPSERVLDPTEIVVRIDQPMAAAVQHLECAMIQHALRTTSGRMEETAALLGVSRKGLYLKRVRYGLEPPEGAAVAELA